MLNLRNAGNREIAKRNSNEMIGDGIMAATTLKSCFHITGNVDWEEGNKQSQVANYNNNNEKADHSIYVWG